MAIISAALAAYAAPPAQQFEVRGQFAAAPDEVSFVFEVRPPPGVPPIVRRLGAHAAEDTVVLDVASDELGRYTVRLTGLPVDGYERLQIEVSDRDPAMTELHAADVALRSREVGTMAARASADGAFVVQAEAGDGAALLIGTVELPLDPLPAEVAVADVLATYTVAFIDGAGSLDGSRYDVGMGFEERPVLYFAPLGTAAWTRLDATLLPRPDALVGRVDGPGTWLLVKGVSR